MAVFWDVAPRILVDIDRSFREAVFLIREMMMKALSFSETSINIVLHGVTSQKTAIFILVSVKT
jgi:hypothetical protein